MMVGHCMGLGGPPLVEVTISGNQNNVNLFTLAGSPAGAVNLIVTIAAGAVIGTVNTAYPSLYQSQAFAAGSVCTLINNGSVYGGGGSAGAGGNASYPVGGDPGQNGNPGYDAFSILNDWIIYNANGKIFGGGGGAAGGHGRIDFLYSLGGGGGGGGQGPYSGLGGSGGSGDYGGSSGYPGSITNPGVGGPGGDDGGAQGDYGADGGGWGAAGGDTDGATGGAPGKAVRLNGHAVTWLSGYDTSHVKGPVA